MATNTDIELLHRACADNDPDVFVELVKRYQDFVYNVCYRVLRNEADAQDVAQECFMRLLAKAGTITVSLGGWLHRCATQLSIDTLRSRSHRLKRESEHLAMREGEATEYTWETVAPHIDKAMDALPEELRHVVVEHFLRQRSETDIAIELGVSTPAISRRLHEGMEMIRTNLKEIGIMAGAPSLCAMLNAITVCSAPAALIASLGKMAIMGVIGGKGSGLRGRRLE